MELHALTLAARSYALLITIKIDQYIDVVKHNIVPALVLYVIDLCHQFVGFCNKHAFFNNHRKFWSCLFLGQKGIVFMEMLSLPCISVTMVIFTFIAVCPVALQLSAQASSQDSVSSEAHVTN